MSRGPKGHINIRILQTMIFDIALVLGECEILMFMWPFGPLLRKVGLEYVTFGFDIRKALGLTGPAS